jgi:hypothetical protein
MTTPTVPAGWYPDPDGTGGQRYWDGDGWTEHRVPAPESPETVAPRHASHAVDPTPEPVEPDPVRPPSSPEVPSYVPTPPPGSLFTEPAASEPVAAEPAAAASSYSVASAASSYSPPSAAATAAIPQPPSEPPFSPPGLESPESAPDDDRKKLIQRFVIGVAVGLVALIAITLWGVFGNDKTDTVKISSPSTSATKTTSSSTAETSTEAESSPTLAPAPGPGGAAEDGGLTFTVVGVDTATTITSPTSEFLTKDAQGQFIVVHLSVTNTGADAGSYMATLQKLKAAGVSYEADPEASFYVGTVYEDINPGNTLDTSIVFDVPSGTAPESIELHGTAVSPGIEVPLQ